MMILYDAIKTIQNSVFVFFLKKGQKPVLFRNPKESELTKTKCM